MHDIKNRNKVSFISNIFQVIYRISGVIAAFCVLAMMFWGTVGIISRFFFNYSIPALYEASSLMLILAVYLGVPITQHEFGNVRMEFLITKVEGAKRHLIEAFGLFLAFLISGMIFWRTLREAIISVTTGEYQMGIFSFPVWPSRIAIAFGFLFLCLCLFMQFLHEISIFIEERKGGS